MPGDDGGVGGDGGGPIRSEIDLDKNSRGRGGGKEAEHAVRGDDRDEEDVRWEVEGTEKEVEVEGGQ